MYAQVEKPKGNKNRTVANSVGQRKSIKEGFGFMDNRQVKIEHKTQDLNARYPAIVQRIPINETVYYGYDRVRGEYMDDVVAEERRMAMIKSVGIGAVIGGGLGRSYRGEGNKMGATILGGMFGGVVGGLWGYLNSRNPPQTHKTVDELNAAIGLTNDNLQTETMGVKRAVIMAATPNGGRVDREQQERAWSAWLAERRVPLLMHDMTGAQCRSDLDIDERYEGPVGEFVRPVPERHMIASGNNGQDWIQEEHEVNILNNEHDIGMLEWTDEHRDLHDDFVNAVEGEDVEAADQLGVAVGGRVVGETVAWLRGNVMHRFWRLTSKIGLDFFNNENIQVAFVREADAQPHERNGRRSITDSEWEHAQERGYLGDNVYRVNPRR